jgi:hypothetical protein
LPMTWPTCPANLEPVPLDPGNRRPDSSRTPMLSESDTRHATTKILSRR